MPDTLTTDEKKAFITAWAERHGCTAQFEGEVGFGRECVGILGLRGGSYVDLEYLGHDYRPIGGVCPPFDECVADDLPDRYHKHECLAVLGRGEGAIDQLYRWVAHLDAAGIGVVEKPKQMQDVGLIFGGETMVTVLSRG